MSRKLQSFKWTIWSVLLIDVMYFIMIGITNGQIDKYVIYISLAAVGGDAVAMKLANAIGDHGALKRGTAPNA